MHIAVEMGAWKDFYPHMPLCRQTIGLLLPNIKIEQLFLYKGMSFCSRNKTTGLSCQQISQEEIAPLNRILVKSSFIFNDTFLISPAY